ncbi:signal recognition particle-docking protein FtsY [archaeon]|nr:signal recognition particle-docking protein FtsY [archaeon]
MFNLIKKKITGFAQKITEQIAGLKKDSVKQETIREAKPAIEETISVKPPAEEKQAVEAPAAESTAIERQPEESRQEEEITAVEQPAVSGQATTEKEAEEIKPLEEKSFEVQEEQPAAPEEKKETVKQAEEKREGKINLGFITKVKSFLTQTIEIKESEVEGFLAEFELSLMEADVSQEVAEQLTGKIKEKIVGKKIPKGTDLIGWMKENIKQVLKEEIDVKAIDLLAEIKGKEKPFIIMFLGPNGAGKSTTIAKLAFRLKQKEKLESILAAGDTFRAAAIEQLEKHAEKLGMRIVKHKYGADPAAVAFDAVQAAKAGKIDIVLIDTAGRQETNVNLMNELKKIAKVNKPDLKVFVGEALAGKALIQQAAEYDKEIGIDCFILTKIDADVKGGTAISLLAELKKPILFVGTGQEYKDLLPFTKEFIIDRVA